MIVEGAEVKKNNKNNLLNQFGGLFIAIIILAIFFYKNDEKNLINYSKQNYINQDSGKETTNGLKEVQIFDQKRKESETQYAQPFEKNIMIKFPSDGAQKGTLQFQTSDKDAVFLVRDKFTNNLQVVIQLPKFSNTEMKVPLGEYIIEYATGDGEWQGLDRLWGYSTQFYRSNTQHRVYRNDHENGYTIHGTGIVLNAPNGYTPEKINKNEFIHPN